MLFTKLIWLTLVVCVFFHSTALAQGDFYGGKVLRIVVGFPPGGGYDTYSRLIARHLGRHIPGNPTIIVENMTGAGSLIAANHIYRAAKSDGLSIGHFIGGLFLQQLLGKSGIEFDARRFEYIGAPAQDNFVMGLAKATGITGVQQWIASKTVIKFGGVGFGAGTDDIPAVAAADPEREAASREIARGIRACLQEMVRDRRLAVTLHLQGHSVGDAARILEWAQKRTENLVYRGLADLRACLAAKGLRP